MYILYLVAAKLLCILLEHIAKHSSLKKTEKMVLRLMLLHVATLSLNNAHPNFDPKKIMQSMHEVYTLDYNFESAHNIVSFSCPTYLLSQITQLLSFILST